VRESGETIPVTVLTGFAGAGKTTVLHHLLQSHDHGMRLAVVENGGRTVELKDEIIKVVSYERFERVSCCINIRIRSDLVKTLQELEERISSFDGVIIETTGMAEPEPIVQTLFLDERITQRYHLDGFITVVDPQNVMMQLAQETCDGVNNVSVEQIAFADRIVLNKCELVDDDEQLRAVEKALKFINTYAAIVRSKMGCLESSSLLNISAADISRAPAMDPEYLDTDCNYQPGTSVSSINIFFVGELNVHKLQFWIRGLMKSKAKDLLRYKGLFAVKGTPMKCVFNGLLAHFSCMLEQQYEWQENEIRECRLVLIGRNLDKAELEKSIMECKVGPLRFQLGDRVRVNVDGEQWMNGVIVKLWDEDFPYLIEVELAPDSCRCPLKCWAPIDDDQYVKKWEYVRESSWKAHSEAFAHGTKALC